MFSCHVEWLILYVYVLGLLCFVWYCLLYYYMTCAAVFCVLIMVIITMVINMLRYCTGSCECTANSENVKYNAGRKSCEVRCSKCPDIYILTASSVSEWWRCDACCWGRLWCWSTVSSVWLMMYIHTYTHTERDRERERERERERQTDRPVFQRRHNRSQLSLDGRTLCRRWLITILFRRR